MKRLAYGFYGLPLALAALPVHVHVPALYAERFGLPLALIGGVLLAARLADAFLDPLIGAWLDKRGARGFARAVMLGSPLLAAGFVALFLPPAALGDMALAWFIAALVTTYLGYSMTVIAHQGWGAALTQAPGERARLVAVREAFGLGGVLLAAGLLQVANAGWLAVVFLICLAASAALLLGRAPRPAGTIALEVKPSSPLLPFRDRSFRWLFAVFLCNGIAAAIPATLFVFYSRDALQLADTSAACLLLYFLAAAISLPAWARAAQAYGEARAWLGGMLLALASFAGAYWIGPGNLAAFATICMLSGLALGADLVLPSALLAGVIRHAGHSGQHEGAYFGAWNWASKFNLALAAGIALPLLAQLGYRPGAQDAAAIDALRFAYAVLPCILKLGALALLARAPLRKL